MTRERGPCRPQGKARAAVRYCQNGPLAHRDAMTRPLLAPGHRWAWEKKERDEQEGSHRAPVGAGLQRGSSSGSAAMAAIVVS
jgi:hypothetical protein